MSKQEDYEFDMMGIPRGDGDGDLFPIPGKCQWCGKKVQNNGTIHLSCAKVKQSISDNNHSYRDRNCTDKQ